MLRHADVATAFLLTRYLTVHTILVTSQCQHKDMQGRMVIQKALLLAKPLYVDVEQRMNGGVCQKEISM